MKNFEIVIRLLGGLLSGYQLTGDERLLKLAEDLGTRLLPAFDSPTGLPYVNVNLRTGKASGNDSNPAETGTLLLEFGTLSKLTGNPVYYDKAKRALVETYKRRSKLGLVGERSMSRPASGRDTSSHVGARIDSYYEYLWKCWRLFGDEECLAMWKPSIAAANRYYAEEVDGALWYGQVDMHTGKRTGSEYGALDAFYPGLLALLAAMSSARVGCRRRRSRCGTCTASSRRPTTTASARSPTRGYPLRPEIVESAWYLYRLTGDPQYRAMGKKLFEDFVRHCRTDAGYAALKDVTHQAAGATTWRASCWPRPSSTSTCCSPHRRRWIRRRSYSTRRRIRFGGPGRGRFAVGASSFLCPASQMQWLPTMSWRSGLDPLRGLTHNRTRSSVLRTFTFG